MICPQRPTITLKQTNNNNKTKKTHIVLKLHIIQKHNKTYSYKNINTNNMTNNYNNNCSNQIVPHIYLGWSVPPRVNCTLSLMLGHIRQVWKITIFKPIIHLIEPNTVYDNNRPNAIYHYYAYTYYYGTNKNQY